MTTIFITGFMGAGKTTVGKGLGEQLDCKVIDTDAWIENEQGKSIQEIFTQEGEDSFRQYETRALKQATQNGVVITTGGGIVSKDENRNWMKEHGILVYLHCTPEECIRRLSADTQRPLLNGKNQNDIAEMLKKRLPDYKKADVIIDTTGETIAQVIEKLMETLFNSA